MRKCLLLFVVVLLATGCKGIVKDVFEIAATPEELAAMSSIDVCKHLGYSQWRNQPQAYLDAKEEAEKRILANSVKAEDCKVFAEMAMRSKSRAASSLSGGVGGISSKTGDGCYWVCNDGEWMAVKNGVCIMPIKPVSLCM